MTIIDTRRLTGRAATIPLAMDNNFRTTHRRLSAL